MKHVSVAVLALLVFGGDAMAASARPAMSGKMIMPAPRYTASVNQLNGNGSVAVVTDSVMPADTVDRREAERNACINNNIGVGNTNMFVWASKYSNTSNYAMMTEDVDNPQNNVCFARVELKSDDSKISVADVPAKYFQWGETIECGSWANEKEMEKRILDAKKGARIGGIVASTVGGAGLGVGVMEAFGNRVINGKVMGQKDKNLSEMDVYVSQLLVLKEKKEKKGDGEYDKIVTALNTVYSNDHAAEIDGIKVEDLLKRLNELN